MEDIFRKDDGSSIIEGRRKIYSTETPMKLMLPDGKDDGVLENKDLIYVVQKIKKGEKDIFRFKVLKFDGSDKKDIIYHGDSEFFKRYYDEKSNVVGEEPEKKDVVNENKYKVPVIMGLGFGTISYLLAEKFQKNKIAFAFGGLAAGFIIGYILSNKKIEIKNKVEDKKQ